MVAQRPGFLNTLLAAIHTVGIVHRDVTPQNLLRMVDGRLVLSDFGLAVEGGVTTVHGGTPSYMAPETAMGQRPDQRSDVWQLGSVLHEIFFLRRPQWDSDPRGMSLRSPTSPGSSVLLKGLEKLCRACLSTNPADRPASACAVSARLAALELAPPRRSPARILGRRFALLTAGVVLAAILGGTMLERSLERRRSLFASQRITPADRRLLRSMAHRLKARGELEDARSLDLLAGTDASP